MSNLTEDQQKEMVNMGALGYTPEIVASIMGFPEKEVFAELGKKDSEMSKLYLKGQNMNQYKIDLKLLEMAQSGDIKAIDKLDMRKRQMNSRR